MPMTAASVAPPPQARTAQPTVAEPLLTTNHRATNWATAQMPSLMNAARPRWAAKKAKRQASWSIIPGISRARVRNASWICPPATRPAIATIGAASTPMSRAIPVAAAAPRRHVSVETVL